MTADRKPGSELYGQGTSTREALERLANRWTVLITYALEERPTRFNELRKRLEISAQVLSRVLRELERDGLIARQAYAEVPVRVEYTLTELGGTMCAIVHDIRMWAEQTAPAITQARAVYDESSARV